MANLVSFETKETYLCFIISRRYHIPSAIGFFLNYFGASLKGRCLINEVCRFNELDAQSESYGG